jgi:hypothetical protein
MRTKQPSKTLRDEFAASALTGMLASAPLFDRTKINKKVWVRMAYKWADAMLAERKKRR